MAIGAAGYEHSNKRAINELERRYKSGESTKEEYQKRKKEIEKRALTYSRDAAMSDHSPPRKTKGVFVVPPNEGAHA